MANITNLLLVIAVAGVVFSIFAYQGRIEAYTLTEFDDVDLSVPQRFQIKEEWNTHTNEFLLCLYGRVEGTTVVVDTVEPGDASFEGEDATDAVCQDRFFSKNPLIGTIHSHPSGDCRPGRTDILVFGRSQTALLGIVCSSNNLVFYTQQDLIIGLPGHIGNLVSTT